MQVKRTHAELLVPGVDQLSVAEFMRQVGFREYARYLSFHFPFTHERSLLEHLRALPWRLDHDMFKARCLLALLWCVLRGCLGQVRGRAACVCVRCWPASVCRLHVPRTAGQAQHVRCRTDRSRATGLAARAHRLPSGGRRHAAALEHWLAAQQVGCSLCVRRLHSRGCSHASTELLAAAAGQVHCLAPDSKAAHSLAAAQHR